MERDRTARSSRGGLHCGEKSEGVQDRERLHIADRSGRGDSRVTNLLLPLNSGAKDLLSHRRTQTQKTRPLF